jgi:transcriptional regulator with XRE-family HTH domain
MFVFGENLKKVRTDCKLTRLQLSGRSGVHMNTISDIENGRNKQPSFEKVILLCRALGVEPLSIYPVE